MKHIKAESHCALKDEMKFRRFGSTMLLPRVLILTMLLVLVFLIFSVPIGASQNNQIGSSVPASTQSERPLILISDQQFVSAEPRSQSAIQELLKSKNSILNQWKITPEESALVSTSSGLAYLSEMYSVSPPILLALAENKFRVMSISADRENRLLPTSVVFSDEMKRVAQELSAGFYEYYNGNALTEYTLANGEKVRVEAGNASTYALRRYFASKSANLTEWLENEPKWENEFISTFTRFFGSPIQGNLNAAHPPTGPSAALGLPTLKLPWKNNDSWWFTGGPHTFDGSGPLSAVDYQPNGYAGCNPNVANDRWIAASADGKTVDYQDNWLKLDHDQDGNVSTGWLTVYGHIANRIGNNISVQQGALLGNPSCLGGVANGVHTHFGIKYQNVWQPIDGTVVSGWTIQNGGAAYHGYMRNGGTTKESCSRPGNGWDCSTALVVSDNGGGGGSGGPSGYTYCAKENERCNFSGTKDVAYGANGSFNYKYNISGGIDCNNGTFGDPISGVSKACYTKDSSQTGCNPNSDQVALFEHGGYGGNCKLFNKADYPNPGAMGFANDTASSIKVGGNVKAVLCKDDNYSGGCEDFTGDDGNLGDNSIGDNQVSSLKVQDRGSSGGNGVEFCDGTNYGSPCITLTAGKYGNLNDIGWYDRIESLRFKGNYVGNYHVVLSTETNHGGTPGHYERDEANVPDPWRNRTRSIEIYYIDRNNPPGTPSLASPGDWYESNDGTAPNLCWNASSDPEGDNPVQYYAEVFDSAVNGNSGWTTNTCWRPSNLDNQYYSYQWRVKARDNKNKESGWSETRHFTIRQPAPQKPDLRPATLSGYPAPIVPSSIQGTHQTNTLFAGARTFLDWHFINGGNATAPGGFYVDVYVDNQRLTHYQQPDFGAGQTGGFDDWAETISQPGVHTLKIVTDPENAVQESDENNNVWEQQFTWVAINGWRGEYFKNPTLDSNPWLTRDDANIDFDWTGGSPDPSLPVDGFSARWTRSAAFECGRYRFNVHVDDGVRLWVNNQKILDEWRDQVANFSSEVDVTAGALPIQVEYYENGGGAAIQVNWQKLSSCVTKPSAPHDPNPANGASLGYRTALDISVQGEGEQFIFHVWGNNYDRWSDWNASRSFHLDGLTNQTYNFQAQARNSAGDSPWSEVWTFTIQTQPQPPAAPHDPNPANGANLSYRTSLDVSVQGEGDLFIFHVWGNNYDRWSDWQASRSFHLEGLTNQTYNVQAQARNGAGDSPWSEVWTFTIQPAPQQQLVLNPGFEVDKDNNGIPDNWGANIKFRRVGKPHLTGSYAGRLMATDDKAVTISQKIPKLTGGATYAASCQVNIPATTDTFTFKVQVSWYDSLNRVIGKPVVIGHGFSAKTNGWELVARDIVAPAKAKSAQFQFVATSLKTKLHIDDCSFAQK